MSDAFAGGVVEPMLDNEVTNATDSAAQQLCFVTDEPLLTCLLPIIDIG